MSNEFQTLATHLAGKDVEVVFETKGCNPRVEYQQGNNQPIVYLPASLNRRFIYPTIAATLHETHHVKITDIEQYKKLVEKYRRHSHPIVKQLAGHIVNIFEDIRVDNRVFKDFYNAHQLYNFLIDEAMHIKTGEKDDPINHFGPLLLDYVYLKATGFEDYFNKPIAKEFFSNASIAKAIDTAIDMAKNASETFLITGSCEIIAEIIKKFYEAQKVKEELKQKQQKTAQHAKQKADKAQSEANEIAKQKDEIKEKISKLYGKMNEYNEESSKITAEQTKAGKSWTEAVGSKEYKESREKYNKVSEKMDELNVEKNNIQGKLYEKESEASRQKNLQSAIESDEMQSVIEDLKSDTYGYGSGNVGFETIKKLFKIAKNQPMPDFTENIKTIFSRLNSKPIDNEMTGNINVKNIYKIFNSNETDLRDIFKANRFRSTHNNKLAILLDVSGSMMGKYNLLFETVSSFLKIVDENKDTYNIDTAIAAYSDCTKFFKKFGEEKTINYNNMQGQFYDERLLMNSGTNIIDALNKMQDHIDEESTHRDTKYMVVFTDCVFGSPEMKIILDKFNAEREKIIFIGLGSEDKFRKQNRSYIPGEYRFAKKTRYQLNSTAKTFFEKILFKRMVNSKSNLEKVLLDGFDRIIDRA